MPSKKNIYIIIAVLLFLVALGYFYYRKGKNTVTLQSLPGELPGVPSSGNTVGASNDELKNIANELYADMSGFNGAGHDYEPYQRAILLNDTDLVKLYNAFNTMYQKINSETLTTMISNERFFSPQIPGTLVARLKKLNCL